MRRLCLVLAILASSLAVPARAQGGDAVDTVGVVERLRSVVQEATAMGYRSDLRPFDPRASLGWLARGGVVVLEANLRAGGRYRVVGVCDGECVDLDLRVHTPDGEELLGEDVNTDDVPVVSFVATVNGPHRIAVVMSDCRAELCRFGVRVLGR